MKNHFLFGAGASFGSGHLRSTFGDITIPLGKDLYVRLLNHSLVPNEITKNKAIHTCFQTDFEAGMTLLRREFEGYTTILH